MTKTTNRFLVLHLFLILAVALSFTAYPSQGSLEKNRSMLPESIPRESAIAIIMPVYPEKAVQSGISGKVHIILEIDPEGDVLQIKVKPRTDVALGKATVDAVKQWKFKPWISLDGLPKPVLTRLIFRFSLNDGQPQVELYSPRPDTRIDECLGCTNTAREMRQWRDW